MEIQFRNKVLTLPNSAAASIGRYMPPIEDLREAIDLALSTPIDFSSLDQAIVPGDHIAIAVDPTLPSLPSVVSGITQWLVEHGVAPANIIIVVTAECGRVDHLRRQLDRSGLSTVGIEKHHLDDSQRMSYVAANDKAEAIYVNKTLVDADVVLPISCSRSDYAIDYLGAFGIFPLFSNRETLGHMLSYSRLTRKSDRQTTQSEVQQAAWWLGLLVAIQVVPTFGDQVAKVLCGPLKTLEETAQRLMASGLERRCESHADADLVIAVLDATEQGWSEIARSLHHAMGHCTAGGSIVLCTNLDQPIGSGLRRLRDSCRDLDQIAKRLSKDCSEDALAASVILEATRDHHVYLTADHGSQASIESLGLGFLCEARELTNLFNHHSRSLVIYSAQHP